MKSYSIASFKAQLSKVLDQVSKGEEIIVTDHNRPVAKLVSVQRFPDLPHVNTDRVLTIVPTRLKVGALPTQSLLRKLREAE